jgi:hypothetical protein
MSNITLCVLYLISTQVHLISEKGCILPVTIPEKGYLLTSIYLEKGYTTY